MQHFRNVALILLLVLMPAGTLKAEVWRLTSLSWPPYAGSEVTRGGAGIEALRDVLTSMGDTLEVEFLPWSRAQRKAANEPDIVGYYPAWPSEVYDGFFASEVVFRSPVGFAELQDTPIHWQKLDDLVGKRIAIVATYTYPDEFQALIDTGQLEVVKAESDAAALRMLARKRVDAVAIDKFVMVYLLANDPSLKRFAKHIRFDEKELVSYELVIAMRDTPPNRARAQKLQTALHKIDAQALVSRFFTKPLNTQNDDKP